MQDIAPLDGCGKMVVLGIDGIAHSTGGGVTDGRASRTVIGASSWNMHGTSAATVRTERMARPSDMDKKLIGGIDLGRAGRQS